jgi:hypothetical protein
VKIVFNFVNVEIPEQAQSTRLLLKTFFIALMLMLRLNRRLQASISIFTLVKSIIF